MYITQRQQRETGRDYALRTIRDNIVRLELKPGSLVSENELASEMGISRTPVREALIDLSKVNIIEVLPQKGSRVSLIDFKLVEEAQFMRRVLECAVAEYDCGRISDSDYDRLRENLAMQELYTGDKEKNKNNFLELDNIFHGILFDIAGKSEIYGMMGSFSIHFDRVRNLTLDKIKAENVLKDHRQIVEAITKGEASKASEYMEHHLGRFRVAEDQIKKEYPGYFAKHDRI